MLFPLFWRFRDDKADRTTTVVLNYLHRRHGDETTDALFPLLHYRRGARPGGQPETSFTLFPLVHYQRTPERPRVRLAARRLRPQRPSARPGFIPPYFWYQSRSVAASGVPPLYFDFTRLDTRRAHPHVRPLGRRSTPRRRSARVLFPLFGALPRRARRRGTWVFPTYFRRRTNDGYALDTLLPAVLVLALARPQHHGGRAPGTGGSGPSGYATGLVPLLLLRPQRRAALPADPAVLPARRTTRTAPASCSPRCCSTGAPAPTGTPPCCSRCYWAGRNGPRSHTVLFPLVWHFSDDEEKSSVNLVGPVLLVAAQGGSQRTRGIMPLAWYSRDDEKRTASHALLPLFYEKHGPSQQTVLTLPFGFSAQPDRSWWYALNVFRRDSGASSFTMVFPLWFSHLNKTTETTHPGDPAAAALLAQPARPRR